MTRLTRWSLTLAVLSGAGGSLLVAISEKLDPLYTFGLGALYVILIAFILFQIDKVDVTERNSAEQLEETRRAAEEDLAKIDAEKAELARLLAKDTSQYSVNLLERTLVGVTKVARSLSKGLRNLWLELPSAVGDVEKTNKLKAEAKDRFVPQLLECLRAVFQSDNRGVDTTKYPYSVFKLAVFEPKEVEGRLCLERTFFDYPDGLFPHDETMCVFLDEHPNAAHVRAYNKQDIQIIEDIPSEAKRQNGSSKWEDLRPNQSSEYQSMFCAAIVRGEKESPDRKVLGVLVVDTNRTRYFMENREYRLFLYKLMSPFRTLLSLSLTLTE